MRCVRRSCSSLTLCSCRCVDRACPNTRHTRRSETSIASWISSAARRRLTGLKSFPVRLPSVSSYQSSDLPRPDAIGCSLPPVPLIAWPDQLSSRHIPFATCNTLHRLFQAGASPPRSTSPWLARPLSSLLMISSAVCFCLLIPASFDPQYIIF